MKNENQITVNMENLSNEEREQLLKLVERSNKQPKKRWNIKKGERYYFIDDFNCMVNSFISDVSFVPDVSKDNADDRSADENLYKIGNCFKTEEEAEFELQKRLVYQELKDYALEHNEIDVDWTDGNVKWSIHYNTQTKCLGYDFWYTYCTIGQVYFSSEKIVQEAIKAVGEDRIKKYLFGVE